MRLGKVRVSRPGGRGAQLSLEVGASSGRTRELTVLDERERGTRFLSLGARSVLNSPSSTGMGFWSINPYVGCEFGCTYCYARDTHRYSLERAERRNDGTAGGDAEIPPWLAFEKRILVKTDIAERLARTLDPSKLGHDSLVIGTATDPYQPAERRYRLTRSILDVLTGFRGLRVGIISKSPLVTRDIDLLQQLSERHEVTVTSPSPLWTPASPAGSSSARRSPRHGSARSAGSAQRGSTPACSSPRSSPASPTTAKDSAG